MMQHSNLLLVTSTAGGHFEHHAKSGATLRAALRYACALEQRWPGLGALCVFFPPHAVASCVSDTRSLAVGRGPSVGNRSLPLFPSHAIPAGGHRVVCAAVTHRPDLCAAIAAASITINGTGFCAPSVNAILHPTQVSQPIMLKLATSRLVAFRFSQSALLRGIELAPALLRACTPGHSTTLTLSACCVFPF